MSRDKPDERCARPLKQKLQNTAEGKERTKWTDKISMFIDWKTQCG